MAAAAALATSTGVSSSIRGWFLVFTLLCLVCLSSALIDKKKLEELKETYQKTKEQVDKLKVKYEESVGFNSDVMSEFMRLIDPMIALMKKIEEKSADDEFPPLNSFMESIKNYVEKTKTYSDRKYEEVDEHIKETEKKLDKFKKLIELFEEQQAEL